MIALNCFELSAVSGGWNNESATSSSRPSSSSAAKAKPKNRKSVRDIRRANSSKKSKSSNRAAVEAICSGLNSATGTATISHTVDFKAVKVTATVEVSCGDL
jgi:uncharacterized membrane protein